MNGFTEQERDLVRGLDPAVVAEYAKQTGVSAEVAAADIEKLGRALLDQELSGGAVRLTGRKARRSLERAERKRSPR